MEMTSNKTEQKNIKGISFLFKYPSIADNINISSIKNTLTRGQYVSMSLTSNESIPVVDKISTLSVCVICTDEKFPDFSWQNLPEDFLSLAEEAYDSFIEWKSFFRKNKNEPS